MGVRGKRKSPFNHVSKSAIILSVQKFWSFQIYENNATARQWGGRKQLK
jgi:hypothetical protein